MSGQEGSGWEEAELVRAAQAGSLSAFDQLVRICRPGLNAMARSWLSREEAEDAVQEAFLIAYKALPGLHAPGKFRAWMGSILRSRLARQGRKEPLLPLDELILAQAPALTEEVERRDAQALLAAAISSQPPEIRTCLRLYYLEQWSVKEIADLTDTPATTVKWRLHEGRRGLRKLLGCRFLEES